MIYAFFATPNQVVSIQAEKVKSRFINRFILQRPDDLRLRFMLLEQSKINGNIVYHQDSLLTAEEFAAYLKMNIGTFRNKLTKGEIISGKDIGGSRRWLYKDIVKWVESLKSV